MIRPILQSRFTNHPSRIAVLLVLLAGARAQAQPAGPLSVLDVPYLTQSESLCGGAAAAMVLRYWGERGIDAETFAPLVDRRLAGIRTTVLVGELQRRGWNVTAVGGTSELIAGEIDSGRPVIALIEDRPRVFHYVVIVAITPRGIVLHDPARAPYRVMARDEFERRWRAADRWMAIVRPMDDRVPPPRDAFLRASPQQDDAGTTPAADATQIASAPSEATRLEATRSTTRATCEALVQEGIASAQADDLASAERSLARALSCPGVDAVRELAGVRFLQRRWADAASLATTVTREAPADDYSWKLLGTSLFLENATPAALEAWNHAGEPRLDLLRVDGLVHTRQRPVESLVGVKAGALVTPGLFVRSARRLDDLPAASSTRLDVAPVGGGLAELRATVAERPLVPHDAIGLAAIATAAPFTREVRITLGSLSGGGESASLAWRFWPERPRIAAWLRAPAPWSGVWGVDVAREAQSFDDAAFARSERTTARLSAGNWIDAIVRLEARAGLDRWQEIGTLPSAGMTVRATSPGDRLDASAAIDVWGGARRIASLGTSVEWRSSTSRSGFVWLASGRFAGVSAAAPLDLLPGGDTGSTRSLLLRAHPLVHSSGRMKIERLGRAMLQSTGEVQRWWSGPALSRLAGAAFVDAGSTWHRPSGGSRLNDVDLGVGFRLTSPLLPGVFRLDIARGLRDGAHAVSAVYVVD